MRVVSIKEQHAQFPDIDGFWDFNDLEKTEANIKQAIPQDGISWDAKGVEALTQLARVQGLRGDVTSARGNLALVQKLIEKLDPSTQLRPKIRYALESGRLLGLTMVPTKAQVFFTEAWNLAVTSKQFFFAIDAAIMIATIQPLKSRNEWLQKAIELAEQNETPLSQTWLPQLYLMNGWHSFDIRRFDEALASFEKALAQPRVKGDENIVMGIRWAMSKVLRTLGKTNEALEIQKSLLKDQEALGKVNGHVYLELAENYQALQDIEESRKYFELAYKDLSTPGWYADNHSAEIARMLKLYKQR